MSISNIRRSVLVLAGAGLIALGGLFAGRLVAGAMPADGAGGHFGPARFAHIAKALDLSDDQKAQVKAILKTHATEIESQMKAGAEYRRALRDAILAEPIDDGIIRSRAADLARVEGNGAVLYAHVRAEIYPLLNDVQKQKVQQFRSKMQARTDHAAKAFQDFIGEDGS